MAEAVADNVPAKATPIDGKPPLFGLSFLENLSQMTVLRQVGLLVGLAASVAIGFAVVLWSQQPDYRPLYGSLAGMDAKQVMETLAAADIPYNVEPNSGALLVKADDLSRARMKLAAAGVTPSDGNIGFEILDKEQGLGTSQFMEATRYRRGLEGELARTISSLNNVKGARVHLAIPKSSVFVRDERKPSASVLVELYSGRSLEPGQPLVDANGQQIMDPATGQPMLAPYPADKRQQSTKNFELDRSISHTKQQQGRLNRLSVSVVVDDQVKINPANGETSRAPWSADELARFTRLVQDAVGFDASRGDSVSVINMPFSAERGEVIADIPFYSQPWFWDIVKQVLGVLFILVLVFGVLRPVLNNITGGGKGKELAGLGSDVELGGMGGLDGELANDRVSLGGPQSILLPSPSEGYDAQLNAIKSLVAEDPGRVAQVVKEWINADE